ncbi:MAG: membrane protein insertase YidC [Nocardioidaceae bacterium]
MLESLGAFGHAIMTPLYYGVSAIMIAWHWAFEQIGLNPHSGWTWALSIIGLTVTIRALLIPLFVKQIKSSRNMQLLQPKIKELQKKYSHDRERLAQEQMKLWKDTGTNPFASCLPLILQMPIFFALFRTIDHAANNGHGEGVLTDQQAQSMQGATLLGARVASRFIDSASDGGSLHVKILTLALVVIMCITTFMTQRQLMSKNMPKDAMSGPYAQQQKMLLYVLPFVFAVGGVAFPIGVLLYWTTSNAWTMCQQFYVIRNNPAPGTPAFRAKQDRDKRHGRGPAEDPTEAAAAELAEDKTPPRQQPKRQTRDQRKKQAPGQQPAPGPQDEAQPTKQESTPSQPKNKSGSSAQQGPANKAANKAAQPGKQAQGKQTQGKQASGKKATQQGKQSRPNNQKKKSSGKNAGQRGKQSAGNKQKKRGGGSPSKS